MTRLLFLAAFLGGCEPEKPRTASGDCVDFDYGVTRDGRNVVCHILQCSSSPRISGYTGGPMVLWCDEQKDGGR